MPSSGQLQLPVDYNAIRVALIQALRDCTGLDAGNVVMAEPERPGWPRPARPFLTMKWTSVSIMAGDDEFRVDTDSGEPVDVLCGQREMRLDINSFGNTHEEAYVLLSAVQTGMGKDPICGYLDEHGVAVWNTGDILDLSSLLATGFEGRATMELIIGVASNAVVDYGAIEVVDIEGTVDVPPPQTVAVEVSQP